MLYFRTGFVSALFVLGASAWPAPVEEWPPHGLTYRETVLRHHNVHRVNHSAPLMYWGPHMYEAAVVLAENCVYGHNTSIDSGYGPYGQNIAAGTAPDQISSVITEEMYNGEINWFNGQYGEDTPDFANFEHYGHFSQIVWKGSTHVGCYTANCNATGLTDASSGENLAASDIAPYFTVCNYWPVGNVGGEWADNVEEPLGFATVSDQY